MFPAAIISRKGGAAKTTLACGLAVAGEREGHATALVDLDPQGSASAWDNLRVADTPRCHLAVRGSTTRPPGVWGCSRWPAARGTSAVSLMMQSN